MSPEPLVIWCNQRFPEASLAALREGVRPHRLVLTTPDVTAPPPEADVAFGQPDADLAAAAPRLRWIHVSTAGYTSFDRPAIRAALVARGARLTTSSGVYADPCAQHLLSFMLMDARQLVPSVLSQHGTRAWLRDPARATSYLLAGQTALLVGFGSIGARLCELLRPFGINLVGVRRQPRGDEPIPMVPLAELDRALATADHVLNMLPASADSEHLFDRGRFAAMRAGAVFYNIGRGTTVDQDALREALTSGRLRAAYLDVTDPEPLPPAHPLWTTPACVITPHSGGGHANERARIVEHFLTNLRRHEAGEPLLDTIV
jgi:phosphoglycerate dehydrogenase-like enzyme